MKLIFWITCAFPLQIKKYCMLNRISQGGPVIICCFWEGGGEGEEGDWRFIFLSLHSTLPILSHCQLYFSLSTSHGSMNWVAVSSRPPFLFFPSMLSRRALFVTARFIKMWIKKKRGKKSSEVIATTGLVRVNYVWVSYGSTLLLRD